MSPLVRMIQLRMENFRPYYKQNIIDFSTIPQKNFNVICGGSGSGKTTIMDAISWCMYGEEQHKTGKVKGDDTRILNDKIKDESDVNDVISVTVEILFGEKDAVEYRFLRSMDFRKISEDKFSPIINSQKFSVKVTDDRNNTVDYPYPENAVNWIFPQKIKHLFKFDGEQLKNFFERDNSNKTKQAIKDITQINKLELVTERINKVLKEYKPKKTRSHDIEGLESLLISGRRKIEEFNNNLKQLQDEYTIAEKELNGVEARLKLYGDIDIEALIRKQKEIADTIGQIESGIKETKKEKFAHILQSLPNIFCHDVLVDTYNKIESKYESGELPSDIKEGFVKRLLERKKCICHTSLDEGSEARKFVEEYLKLVPLSKYEDKIRHGQQDIGKRINSIKSFSEQRILYEKRIVQLEDQLSAAMEEAERLKKTLNENQPEMIKSLLSQRTSFQNDLARITKDMGNIEGKIETTQEDNNKIEIEIRRLTKRHITDDDTRLKFDIGTQIIDFVDNLQENLLKELKTNIESQTDQIFRQCVKEPRVSKVIITDDYECQVIDKKGFNFYSELSEGQKEALAASFMMALRQDSGFNSPIIFDFPFGRIDNRLRTETIEALKKILAEVQVIFILIEDTEFRDLERKLMAERLGPIYQLKKKFTESQTEVIKLD